MNERPPRLFRARGAAQQGHPATQVIPSQHWPPEPHSAVPAGQQRPPQKCVHEQAPALVQVWLDAQEPQPVAPP